MNSDSYEKAKQELSKFCDTMASYIEDWEAENVILTEKLEYEIRDKEDNYRRLTPAELIDWNDRW